MLFLIIMALLLVFHPRLGGWSMWPFGGWWSGSWWRRRPPMGGGFGRGPGMGGRPGGPGGPHR